MDRQGRKWRTLLHRLNHRYRAEFDRAERLQAELDDIRGSRLWRWFTALRTWRKRFTFRARSTPLSTEGETLQLPSLPLIQTPVVSLIIPFKDDAPLLAACLKSLCRSTYQRREIILVDNGSQERRTARFLQRWQQRREGCVLSRPAPFNFAWLCNEGARQAQGEVLLFLNNDTEVLRRDWLEQMLAVLAAPRIGIVGATLLYPDGTLQHAGLAETSAGWTHLHRGQPAQFTGEKGELQQVRTVAAVTGACLMIRRELFWELGGFDERFPVTMNDVDLCLRARQHGWLTALTPHARLLHYESLGRGYTVEKASCSTA
jgi:GT2 family glycosyltransferase